jgi:hypothetical protein
MKRMTNHYGMHHVQHWDPRIDLTTSSFHAQQPQLFLKEPLAYLRRQEYTTRMGNLTANECILHATTLGGPDMDATKRAQLTSIPRESQKLACNDN